MYDLIVGICELILCNSIKFWLVKFGDVNDDGEVPTKFLSFGRTDFVVVVGLKGWDVLRICVILSL